jgi:hypothetical protein
VEDVLHELNDVIIAVPFVDELTLVILPKLQLGVVFNVKVVDPVAFGVPVAVKIIFCGPRVVNVPAAAKATPLAVAEIE